MTESATPRTKLRRFTSGGDSLSHVIHASTQSDIDHSLASHDSRGLVARGAGRNYGDAADNSGGSVVLLSRQGHLTVDGNGLLRVGGGVTLQRILETVHPLGWTLPVVPATRHVTVGGAIASDVHGKNHVEAGSFGRHVSSLTLSTPTGRHTVTKNDDQDLLEATVGGMGLTGIIVDAAVQLIHAESTFLVARQTRCSSLDDIMGLMSSTGAEYRIAWIDAFARGSSLGRGVVVEAHKARSESVITVDKCDSRDVRWRHFGSVPTRGAPRLLRDHPVRLFNSMWWRRPRRREQERLVRFDSVLMPLDAIDGWNRLYGRRGFVQYQFAVPDSGAKFITSCLEQLQVAGLHSYFTTLKRLGAASGRFLSFARSGWSLSLDIPRGARHLLPVLDGLDRQLLDAGGRIYLAKDSRMRGELVPVMYPDLEEFRVICARVDPDHAMQSDLSRRLRLTT